MSKTLRGRGLFAGSVATVTLSSSVDGPLLLAGISLADYAFVPSLRTSTVRARGSPLAMPDLRARRDRKIAMVEHLFAALAGLGVRRGISIEVDGDEMPLLDGAAALWCAAIDELGASSSPRPTRISRNAEVRVGASRYRFFEGEGTRLSVDLELADARLEAHAAWDGDTQDFRDRIAPARTFVFARELEDLAARGMMAHVEPESVVVIGDDGLHAAGRPASFDEPARHKLLDFIGDLLLYGGAPEGRIEAHRPGHAANHEAMQRARAMGIVVDR